jgi:hypothetical protein
MRPQPDPQPVPIASYIGMNVRLLAVCERCWNTAELQPHALMARLGSDCTSFDVRRRLRCSRCDSRNVDFQVNGSPLGAMANHVRTAH